MGYAIKCYFTNSSAEPIRKIWEDLHSSELANFLVTSKSRPGLTLGTWDCNEEDVLKAQIQNFMRRSLEVPLVQTFGVAAFPTDPAQVFLGIVPSEKLLLFHKIFHQINPILSSQCSSYYHPGLWVPHSTLALRCPRKDIPKILERCLQHNTRMEAQIQSLGLLEMGTARPIFEMDFEKSLYIRS